MGSTEITDAILGAWEEDEDEQALAQESEGAEPDATSLTGEVQDEAPSDDIEAEAPETDEEEEVSDEAPEEPGEEVSDEEPSDEEEPEEVSEEEAPTAEFSSDDPEVQAYLARHGNDVEASLKAAVSQEKVVGRQGRELGQLRQHVAELEADAQQAALFSPTGHALTVEQQGWVEEAVGSDNPLGYIQLALQEGEFGLARAVLDQGEFTPQQIIRLSQGIDAAEGRMVAPEPQGPLDHQVLFSILQQHYPDMPQYEAEMTTTLAALGSDHPISLAAHSQDPAEAAQGIIGLYEIARAKTATVASTREQVKTKKRQAADDVRRQAQVTSAQATRNQAQAPRPRQLMPGLTLEALEAEFDTE